MNRTIMVVGEGMLELSTSRPRGTSGWALGYGGDTLNTAMHLARLGRRVAFVTALGTDALSNSLRRDWTSAERWLGSSEQLDAIAKWSVRRF
ncbi:PfkB family carbohydrate kinase, partial [Sphingomonas sp. Leaf25]|uniref:PfkB family carbohydrate kinase n=1 Tax=Sphingomonas sp. Leaf25 TaxID=1735692 RepID=UPI001F2BB1ED